MSILIKGMDKPTDCGLCPFEDFGYCNVKGERNTSEEGIDADCPLIEVADRKTENSSEIPNNCETCKWWYLDEHFGMTCMIFMNGDLPCHYEPKTEPQTSCKTCRYGEVDEGYVRCAYYSKSTEQDEPQTDGILFKGNLKEGDYKLIKTTDGWVLEGEDIVYCGLERRSK